MAAGSVERPQLTRGDVIGGAAGHPGIHVPDSDPPPCESIDPIEMRGVPTSRMLLAG